MPTYEYVCDKCGYEFELFQSMSELPIKNCPECKAKNKVRRLIGCGAGIIFKGSGFYETDYKRKSSSPPSQESKPKTDKTESKKSTSKKNKEAA